MTKMLSSQFLGDPSKRCPEMTYLHPKAIAQFMRLEENLKQAFVAHRCARLILPFETYRTPSRQEWLLVHTQSTKAPPWSSSHQYGLAVDFVPYVEGQWSWQEQPEIWKFLAEEAARVGLRVPYAWDKVHVEHPLFLRWRAVSTEK